jgi:hypothetical protein
VPGAFHGEVPGPVWPAEDSHSPWTGFRGPRHYVTVDIDAKQVSPIIGRTSPQLPIYSASIRGTNEPRVAASI